MDKQMRAEVLATRIELLFQFCGELQNYKDLLQEVASTASSRASLAGTMAPIFGAMGEDYEEAEMQNVLYAKRASAILNLLNVLEESEDMRINFEASKAAKEKGREQLKQIFGGK